MFRLLWYELSNGSVMSRLFLSCPVGCFISTRVRLWHWDLLSVLSHSLKESLEAQFVSIQPLLCSIVLFSQVDIMLLTSEVSGRSRGYANALDTLSGTINLKLPSEQSLLELCQDLDRGICFCQLCYNLKSQTYCPTLMVFSPFFNNKFQMGKCKSDLANWVPVTESGLQFPHRWACTQFFYHQNVSW